jgi:hypothetical protein
MEMEPHKQKPDSRIPGGEICIGINQKVSGILVALLNCNENGSSIK